MIIRNSALAIAVFVAAASAPAAWAGSSNTTAKPDKSQQTATQDQKKQTGTKPYRDGMLRDKHKTFKGKFKQHHGFGGQLHADR